MDTAMRDLDQIQERDAEGEGTLRKAGTFVVAAGVTGLLVYAMASILGDAAPPPVESSDPLAALARSESLAVEAAAIEDDDEELEVDRAALRFPEQLGQDPVEALAARPEVAAALAAAAAEHEMLGEEAPAEPVAFAAPVSPVARVLPAAVTATPTQYEIEAAAQEDPLVAQAVTAPAPVRAAPRERGQVGHDGEYTLQVVSYRTRAEAELFAEQLRDGGHDSFLMEAEVEGRGRFYRVRIGPFETRAEAERYRRSFEAEERMDSFIVRRRD